MDRFEDEYLQKPNAELEHVRRFKESTEKRIRQLGDIKMRRQLFRHEEIELDMCKGDLKRAIAYLEKEKKK